MYLKHVHVFQMETDLERLVPLMAVTAVVVHAMATT